ncbi:MAG TPA: HlyD family efflux transporter periplasmic adaptor subunit [Terriglobia bacterium]|nr:HlyD family efflux transporter periplasmic adaptor subunit [Terriglobia bacterium]
MSVRKKIRLGIILLVLAALGVAGATALQETHVSRSEIPTTRVKLGTVETRVYTDGELRPSKTAMLVAPPVGGTLQIVQLAKTGTRVKANDVVLEFDPSEQEYNLDQAKSDLAQAEQEITKSKADAAVQTAQDQVDLLKARYAVRSAELDVSKNELLSAIDAKKNLLTLEQAKRQLEQLLQDIKSRTASGQATIAVSEEKRNKARIAMQQAQSNIEKMTIRAPLSGLVAVKENIDSTGGFFTTGMVLPEYRQGDQVQPGRLVAQVLDVDQMEIQSKVDENDRANINPGQSVEVHVDALPGVTYTGKVKTVAGMASNNFWGGQTVRKFDASFQLDKSDPRLRPGVTAQVIILGDKTKSALYLPPQAVFSKDGKLVVYVKNGSRFDPHDVKIVRRTEGRLIIEGLSEGTEVALVNPEQQGKKTPKASGLSGPSLSGGGQ